MNLSFLNSRRFRQGAYSSAVTALFLAVVVVLNGVVTNLSDRYALYIDVTSTKVFTMSQQSKDYIMALDKDVEIFILNTEENFSAVNEYFTQANEVIRHYQRINPGRVTLSYIDIVRDDPNFTSNFPELQLGSNSIIVACGDKNMSVSPYDLFNVEYSYYGMGGAYITSSKAEQTMTSAIMRVSNDSPSKALILTGHNGIDVSALTSLLTLNNYTVEEVNLLTQDLDSEASLAIIAAPRLDFSEDQLNKLDAFLDDKNGIDKTILYFASPEQPELPNLQAYLAEWGIGVSPGVIYESNSARVIQSPYFPFVDYIDGEMAQSSLEQNVYATVPYARPLSVLFESKSNIEPRVLLAFSETAAVQPAGTDTSWQPDQSQMGAIPALVMSQRVSYPEGAARYSTVLACASTVAVDGAIMEQTYFANSGYFLNLIGRLTRRETSVMLESKSLGGQTLGINILQVAIIALVLTIILPLGLLITGVTVWLRRRHR